MTYTAYHLAARLGFLSFSYRIVTGTRTLMIGLSPRIVPGALARIISTYYSCHRYFIMGTFNHSLYSCQGKPSEYQVVS